MKILLTLSWLVNASFSSCILGFVFCRVMLCSSAAYAVAQCLSICLAVTYVYCVDHILKLFHYQVATMGRMDR